MKLESKRVVGCGLMTASFLMMTGFRPITTDALTQEERVTPSVIAFAQNSTWSDVLEEKNELSMKLRQMGLVKEERQANKVALSTDEADKTTEEEKETVASVLGDAGHAGIAQVESIVAQLPEEELSIKETLSVRETVKSPWDGKAMAKVDDSANVRVKADRNSQLVGSIFKGTRVDVVKQGKEWSQIKSGKVSGYVNNKYLAFGKEAESLAKKDTKVMATVKTNGLRIRKAAGTNAEVSAVADKGSRFAVKAQKDGWVKIAAEGGERYVSAEFVEVKRQYTRAKTVEEIKKEQAEKKAREEKAAKAVSKAKVSSGSSNRPSSSRKTAVNASADTTSLLAALIYCEAGGECYEAQVAVGAVVMNRVRSGSYPNSIRAVIYQSGQFGPAVTGKLDRILASRGYTNSCVRAAKEALAGRDNVNGALYFGFGNRGIKIGKQCFY